MPEVQPRRSPEVEAIFARILKSFESGDVATIRRYAPPSPEFRSIGSDPDEWWDGETFVPIMEAQIEEMGGLRAEVSDVEAWEAGSTAWGAAKIRIELGAVVTDLRVTAVFVLDEGMWRVVQWHASEGVPNEESLGIALTTTLTEILDDLDIERDLGSIAGEGMLTLMFTDVAGSTGHARELGDRRFTEMMAEHIDLVRTIAGRRDGQVVKTVGDGALLVFSSARAAIACAVEIQRATAGSDVPYAIRIGVHAGDVVRTDTDVMGFAVNKAARVTSAADGGQVVVSSVVQELVGSDPSYRFGEPFLAELKGIDGIHALVPVEWQVDVARADGGLLRP
jgi:class 3 adenylate cyclase